MSGASRIPIAAAHLLRFPGTIAGLGEAEGALRRLLDEHALEGGPRYNVELAFDEIAANIVRHGSPTLDIIVVVRFEDDEIVLIFEDDGVAFDPVGRQDPVLPASIEDAAVGGLGLMLARQVSTRMTYERTLQHRNHLTLAIPRR